MDFSILSRHRKLLMGLAALLIFYFHIAPEMLSGVPVLSLAAKAAKDMGHFGVDVFLMLSAFGLYFSFSKGSFSWKRYAVRRALRVYPAYAIAAVPLCLTMGMGLDTALSSLLFIPQLKSNFFALLWFVPCILVYYLIAPPYYRFVLARAGNRLAAGLTGVGISILLAYLLRDIPRQDLLVLPTRLPVFLMGFCMGILAEKRQKLSRGALLIAAAVFAVSGTLAALLHYGRLHSILPSASILAAMPMVASACLLISALAEWIDRRTVGSRRLFRRGIEFFGEISLEFYCVQELIHKLLRRATAWPGRWILIEFALCFALSALLAWALNRLIHICMKKIPACAGIS